MQGRLWSSLLQSCVKKLPMLRFIYFGYRRFLVETSKKIFWLKLNAMMNVIEALNDRKSFFVGVNTGYVTEGIPDDRYLEFYRRRSSPQLYCAIVGNVVVPGGFGSNRSTPTLTESAVWGEVARAIETNGSVPGIQLATAWEGYEGTKRFVGLPGHDVIKAARELVAHLGLGGMKKVLGAFDHAAQLAIRHGFLHVQFHAAHGYLLSLLVDPRINLEAERALDHIAELATQLTISGIETSIRISIKTGDVEFDAEGREGFQDRICRLPFHYIDLSSGFYNIDKRLIYPSLESIRNERFEESCAISSRYSGSQFIVSGRASQSDWTHAPQNVHVGLCRDLIANPDFLANPANGCRGKNKCHYFSRGAPHISCALWGESLSPS